jgi:transcriptional regulator with XRE-family HTH domain
MCAILTFRLFGSIYEHVMTADPIYKQIGAVIKARRRTLGLKQEALAAKLGISRGSLANVETGRQNVLVHQLYRFAAALDLTPFDLLPQPSADDSRAHPTQLPLPDDLSAEQKEQIARLFDRVDTGKIRERKGKRAISTK